MSANSIITMVPSAIFYDISDSTGWPYEVSGYFKEY